MSYQAKAAQYKKDELQQLVQVMKESPVIGVVNVENLPAHPLQVLRSKMRQDATIRMSKKELIKRAIDQLKSDKKDFDRIKNEIVGLPALLLTKENPFKIAKLIRKAKSKAPAKAGQTAPSDIIIPAGPTQFTPGPIISELGAAGLKTGVEDGKIVIKEDKIVARQGEEISPKLVNLLSKFNIQPMEIGLDLVTAYEDGLVYGKEVLSIDPETYVDMMKQAAAESFGVSLEIAYPTSQNIGRLIGKAYNATRNFALDHDIMSDVVLERDIANAERAAKSIAEQGKLDLAGAGKTDGGGEEKKQQETASNAGEKKEGAAEGTEAAKEEKAATEEKKENSGGGNKA